jgi:hypothetical protein
MTLKMGKTDMKFIILSICTCAKLFVDEESTWHKSNRGRTNTFDGFYTKMTQKGGFSTI